MFGKRSPLRSGKLAKRRRQVFYIKAALVLVAVVGVIGGTAYGLSRPEVTISDIRVVGNETLAASDIRSVVEQELEGKRLFLFPKRSIFLYPRREVEASVLESHKRIKDLKVSRGGLTVITLSISERRPSAAWCDGREAVSEEEVQPTCYFLDERGYIFAVAPDFTGDVYFRYYGGLAEEYPVGGQFLPEDTFTQLALFLGAVSKLGVTVESLEVTEQDYVLTLGGGAEALVSRSRDLAEALANLEAVLTSEEFEVTDLVALDYIDLRFGNKVFYKFKE